MATVVPFKVQTEKPALYQIEDLSQLPPGLAPHEKKAPGLRGPGASEVPYHPQQPKIEGVKS